MSARLKTPRFGIDAASELSAATMHDYGASFALRYVSRYVPKMLTRGEYEALRAAGIDVAVVFEDEATNSLNGHGQGQADATFALNASRAIGMPVGRPIYFAVDFDPAGTPERTDGYFDGVASVLGSHHAGPYGGIEVVRHQLDRGFAYAWQTYAWSAGQLDSRVQLYQYANHPSVDYDHAYYEDFGQWSYVVAAKDPYWFFYDKAVHPRRGNGTWWKRSYHEAAVAKSFDESTKHRKAQMYVLLKGLRDRIWYKAHEGHGPGVWGTPPDWKTGHRGERWQAFNDRMKEVRK